MRRIFLLLAIVGAVTPVVLTGISIADGVGLGEAWDQITAHPATLLVLADLTISAITFFAWMWRDAPAHGMSPWPFVAGTLFIGLCFALPLYLYLRSGKPQPAAAPASP